MKAMKGLLLTIVVMLMFSSGKTAQAKPFTDVTSSHWAKASIDFLADRKIISGYSNGRFGVNDNITRAQAASMIMRYFGWGDLSGQKDPGYPDLKPTHWAYNEIAAIHNIGILTPEGNFKPDAPVTRAEMADILVKTFSLNSITAVKFTDLSRNHWAYQSINTLAGSGITNGYPDGSFRPDANVTRAEFAALMTKLMKEEYTLVQPGYEGAIYDLEVGGNVYQLDKPLLLTDRWLAPAELFEKMGYYLESHSKDELTITTTDGREIHLHEGQHEVWVGETSVQVEHPLVRINGSFYIDVHGILEVLEKPLVFYPEQFLIRLEVPSVTVAEINRKLPEAAVDVIHSKQPYWHWTKRDRDYLELIRRDGVAGKEAKLLAEMNQLTETYFATEKEKRVIRGLNYFSDNVTGKLDAISRGLEARYLLLYDAEQYTYPAVGSSGALGVFGRGGYEYDYLVYDHLFEHYQDNSQQLIQLLTNNTDLPFEHFKGLNIHGIPFSIREKHADGSTHTWAGLAAGTHNMLVVNSGMGTFVHEFGHNWDNKLGDHQAYLKLRGQEGYSAQTSEWADLVVENFAEDFTAAYLADIYGPTHKGVFGQPTDAQLASIRQFIKDRTPTTVANEASELTVNNATLLPDVMFVSDGKLQVKGQSEHAMHGSIKNTATGATTTIELTANGRSFDQVVQLPQSGIYEVVLGNKNMTVVYQ